jgi:autotransporter passenger strand-loop-strand repeat protein
MQRKTWARVRAARVEPACMATRGGMRVDESQFEQWWAVSRFAKLMVSPAIYVATFSPATVYGQSTDSCGWRGERHTIANGGLQTIFAGGLARSSTAMSGGQLVISSGGGATASMPIRFRAPAK